MGNLTDRELLRRYAERRCEEAFREIAERHGPMVYCACRRVLGNKAEAEDAAQAVFMLLSGRAAAVSRKRTPADWLHWSAMLVARNHLRARGRRKRAERQAAELRSETTGSGDHKWLSAEIDAAISSLPRSQRAPLLLVHLQGRSHEAVAGELGVPLGTVKSRLARAVEALRARLRRRGLHLEVAALVSLLAQDATAPAPVGLVTALARAGSLAGTGVTAGSAAAAAMMEAAMKLLFWNKVKLIAAGLMLAASLGAGIPAVRHLAAGEQPATRPAASEPATDPQVFSPAARQILATRVNAGMLARTWPRLREQLDLLGLRVVLVGQRVFIPLLDGRPTLREFMEAIARYEKCELNWISGGTVAVFWRKAPERLHREVAEALKSDDPTVRRLALRRAVVAGDLRLFRAVLAQLDRGAPRSGECREALRDRLHQVVLLDPGRAGKMAELTFKTRKAVQLRWALRSLSDCGPEALPILEKALAHKDKDVRLRAVEEAGKMGGPGALPLLEKGLTDQHASVREMAAKNLERLGRKGALELLGKIIDGKDIKLQDRVALRIRGIGGAEERLLLRKMAGSGNSQLRRRAVEDCLRLPRTEALGTIKKAMADKDSSVVGSAVTWAGFMAERHAGAVTSLRSEIVPALRDVLKTKDKTIRHRALWSLGRIGGKEAHLAIKPFLRDGDHRVRYAAVTALGRSGDPTARDVLIVHLAEEKDPKHKSFVAGVLKHHYPGDPRVEAAIKGIAVKRPRLPRPGPRPPEVF